MAAKSSSPVRRSIWNRSRLVAGLESLEDRVLLTDPGLTLSFSQPSIWEATFSTATGYVTRTNADTSQSVVVSLSNSDTTELSIPATVTINAGQTTATFTARGVDDDLLDGTQTVTVTASATLTPVGGGSFFATAARTLDVVDYETILTLPISVTQLSYGDSGSIWIERSNTDLDQAVVVTIENPVPSELITPETVTIAAGSKSARISVQMQDNDIPDGTRPVNLSFRAEGYRNGGAQVTLVELGTKSVAVAVDGSAFNSDADPEFESVDTTSGSIKVQPNYRGLFEFNTSTYAGRQIEAVALTIDPWSSRYFVGDVFTFDIFAYAGDGVITTADALRTTVKVGSLAIDTTGFFGATLRQSIALNTSAIQTLLDSSTFIGFVIVHTGGGSEYTVTSSEATNRPTHEYPQLQFFLQNDAPVMALPSYNFSVTENSPFGTLVGTVSATDPNAGDILKYSILGDEFGVFAINQSTGAITVSNASRLDYELKPQYVLKVRATDDGRGTLYGEATVVIDLIDIVAPRVAGVWFGYGNDRWAAADDLTSRTAPWRITQVRIAFDRDVQVDVNDLRVRGTLGGTYAFSAFSYDITAFTATWTLATPIGRDRLSIRLDGDGFVPSNDDPDRNIGVNVNGEYLQGGDYDFALDVLYGDVNGDGVVSLMDALVQRGRNGTNDPWADINGDGIVDLLDALLLRGQNGNALP